MKDKIAFTRKLRQTQTKAEKKLWQYLRNGNFHGLKFKRQHPIENFIVDFICLECKVMIKLDGEVHNTIVNANDNYERDTRLEKLGYTVLRFENSIVLSNPEQIFQKINDTISNSSSSHPSTSKEKMYTKTRILSTKKLSFTQRELLLNASFSLIEFDAITIQPLPFESKKEIGNAIIASKNAVRQVLEANIDMNQCFCVGEKTSRLLVENHKKVVKTTENALELAHFIAKNYKNDEFTFFCGNKRRDELPDFLKENNIALDEIPVYKTELNPKKIEGEFDGIFFFSPSAIQSYIQENTIGNSIAFCIGNTTAKEAKKYTKNIIITNKPTIENTIVQAVKHFKND